MNRRNHLAGKWGPSPLFPQRGFTLLEAIVALVILAAALAGAWTWVANDVRALGRVRDLALEEAAVQQAVAELEQIDIAAQPTGSLRWREFRVDWQAEPMEEPRQGRTFVGGASRYQLALYGVELNVRYRERLIATPHVRVVQHRRTEIGADQEEEEEQ